MCPICNAPSENDLPCSRECQLDWNAYAQDMDSRDNTPSETDLNDMEVYYEANVLEFPRSERSIYDWINQ